MSMTSRGSVEGARGYSLVELMVVMAIIAVVGAIAAPRYAAAAARYRVDAAVRALAADIGRVRQQAVAESCSYAVRLTVGDRSYTMTPTTGPNAGVATSVGLLGGPDPVVVVASKFGASDALTIDAFGGVASGGSVVLYASGVQATLVIPAGRAGLGMATVAASSGATASAYATIAAASSGKGSGSAAGATVTGVDEGRTAP